MKNRVLTAVLGICVVMTALTGCGQNEKETELETLEIASIELVTESGAEAAETEFLELDFSELEEEDSASVEVSTGDLIEGEESEELTEAETVEATAEANSRKPGVAEEETDLTEEVTEEVKKDTSKKESTKKDSTEKAAETAKSETVHTEKETELTSLEVETVQQKSETVPESEKVVASERETEAVTEVETESETEVITEVETESETEVVAEAETESETEAVTEVETESETEAVTEAETESETEAVTEVETESETEVVTEVETEIESAEVQLCGIMTVNDRVNVRTEPSTEAEISALFTPGMKLLVVDTEEEWAHVRFESENGLTDGYIKVEFLYSAENIYYAKEKVNVRQEASTDSEKVGELLVNDKVILLEEAADGWMKVCYSTADGIVEAYVKGEFLEQAELMAGMSALAAEIDALEVTAENEAETETEAATEAETVTETEAATEAETETETEVATEAETETETEVATEVETEKETEETEAADELEIMTVSDRVNVRKEADTDSDALDLLIPGNVFELVEEQEEWSLIRYNTEETTIEGYIKTEFTLTGDTIYEATEKVNVRKEASTDSEKVGQLLAGDLVVVIEDEEEASEQTSDAVQEEEWFNVHFSSDSKLVDAYVKAEFLKQVDPEELLFEQEEGQSSDADSTADDSSASDADAKELSNTADADSDTGEKSDETEASVTTLSSGIAGQLELTKLLFPEVASVGIIYSAEDKSAAAQITEYEKYAVSYGLDLQTTEILDAMDIDLAASILVGSVDCVLCLDDAVVNDLVQTICAYADEMEIPVIGISEAQVSMGCVASFDGKTVIWNEAEAAGFELDLSALNLADVKLYQ